VLTFNEWMNERRLKKNTKWDIRFIPDGFNNINHGFNECENLPYLETYKLSTIHSFFIKTENGYIFI